ncbi:hypothetical protein ACN47E_000433 [Coniothyrium glycines]
MTEASTNGTFEALLSSKPFTFRIGKERKEFVVHSQVVAATSHQLNALVNGGLAESQSGVAELEDIEPHDFARFLEYAYRGDYGVPAHAHDDSVVENESDEGFYAANTQRLPLRVQEQDGVAFDTPIPEPEPEPEPEVAEEEAPVIVNEWGVTSPVSRKKKSKRKSALVHIPLRHSFHSRRYLLLSEPQQTILASFEPRSNSAPEEDFTPVFLAHAWLYTFASMRFIEPLRRLALHKLHKTLLMFQPYSRRVGDVIELARYAYSQGEDRKPDGTIEDLRKLVVEYMALEISTFGKHKKFVSLLEEGGECPADLWCIVYREKLSS